MDLRQSEESAPSMKGREAIAEVAWCDLHADEQEVSRLVATLNIFDLIGFTKRERALCFFVFYLEDSSNKLGKSRGKVEI